MQDITFTVVESTGPRSVTSPVFRAISEIKALARQHGLFVFIDNQHVNPDSLTEQALSGASSIDLMHKSVGG